MSRPRQVADAWLSGRVIHPPAPVASHEELANLREQISALKERGRAGEPVGERLLELRAAHHRKTGADGG